MANRRRQFPFKRNWEDRAKETPVTLHAEINLTLGLWFVRAWLTYDFEDEDDPRDGLMVDGSWRAGFYDTAQKTRGMSRLRGRVREVMEFMEAHEKETGRMLRISNIVGDVTNPYDEEDGLRVKWRLLTYDYHLDLYNAATYKEPWDEIPVMGGRRKKYDPRDAW